MNCFFVVFCLTFSICLCTPVFETELEIGTINEPQDPDPSWDIVAAFNRKDTKRRPMETPGLYQGDIILPVKGPKTNKNLISNPDKKWPDGTIYYTIESRAAFTGEQYNYIKAAMKRIQDVSCLKFKERRNERDYISITRIDGCSSNIGRVGGRQLLSLTETAGCFSSGAAIPMHELLHAVGFYHEQSRPDRNNYIRVLKKNVEQGMIYNFRIENESQYLGAPYDTCSIMHYSETLFGINGAKTIELIKPTFCKTIGNYNYLSNYDIRKLNSLYSCQGYPQVGSKAEPTSCSDKYAECTYWTKTYCIDPRYSADMKKNCPLSCGMCQQSCSDQLQGCNYWRKRNFCTNPQYSRQMAKYCPLSCGVCQASEQPTQEKDCNDNDESWNCERYKKSGQCWKDPQGAIKRCPRTCKVCHKI